MKIEKSSIIDADNPEIARKQIEKTFKQNKKVIVKGKDIEFNRKILENKKVYLLIVSHSSKKDRLRQRESGLNQVLCKIAKENNITLAFDLQELIIENKKEKAVLLSRLMQNIKLCRKYKVKFIIINKESKSNQDIFSLLLNLGSDTKTAKYSII